MKQYYLRARYYNLVLGRFMQEDGYRGDGLNLYAYCGNNPVGYFNPSGYQKDANNSCKKKQKQVNGDGGGVSEDIPMLCKAFDDFTEEKEVMFGLVHLVEQFDGEKSIQLILHGILDIMNHSPEWAKILIRRILNDNVARNFFGFELKELNEVVKGDVCKLLDAIRMENPEKFKEKVEEVLSF